MASLVKIWLGFTTLLAMLRSLKGDPQVPCFFIFGDSLLDNGNNNNLNTYAKANYPPYGIDFPGGPTGRFSNGRNLADFLAEKLDIKNPIPAFAAVNTTEEMLGGVNYASGSAGILEASGSHMGERISLGRQLKQHGATVARLTVYMKSLSTVHDYLSTCFYTVGMGNNDYINNFLMPEYYPSSLLYTPKRYAKLLIKTYSTQLKNLYFMGARKVAVFGVGVLGCVLEEIARNGAVDCVDSINVAVEMFNVKLKSVIDELNTNLPDAKFILINMTSLSLGDPSLIGINNLSQACCKVDSTTKAKGQCEEGKVPCSDRASYMFWDNFHLTEIANLATATRAYTATLPTDAYPMDISSLLQLNLQQFKSDT